MVAGRAFAFTLAKRSAVFRKGFDFARQIPRAVVRFRSDAEDYRQHPPLIGNSFPKSGTHLLLQVLEAMPQAVHYGSFIASEPSFPPVQRSEESHVRLIRKIVPGEVLGAHLFFSERRAAELGKRNVAHFFIYRDLRDVAVSEAQYLTRMNRWHHMHRFFATVLKNDEERLAAAIEGSTHPSLKRPYPNIAARFEPYRRWLGREDVCAVRFEDLVGPGRRDAVRRIVQHYALHARAVHDEDRLVQQALGHIDPQRSHTFRSGEAGGWRRHFGERHDELMDRIAGPLLVDLGY